MHWPWQKRAPLIVEDTLDLKALSPQLAAILKTVVGKLDRENLGELERAQVTALYEKLQGLEYTIVSKGMFNGYGAPVEKLKALPPDKRRK